MIRTQLQLTDQQAAALKRAADERGISMAEVMRILVDEHLTAPPAVERRQRALAVVGKFRSGRGDISANHDKYLAEAFDD